MINTVLDYCKNDPDEIQDFIDELVRQRQLIIQARVSKVDHAVTTQKNDVSEKLKQDISNIGLTNRTCNVLRSNQISTVSDLLGFPEKDLIKLPGVGKRASQEAIVALHILKLSLVS